MLFLRLLKKNILWLLLLPVLTAFTVYYFTRNLPRIYRSTATVYTGIASGYSILSDEKGGWVSSEVVNNEFDNLFTTINSPETLLRVGTRLLAHHLALKQADPLVISPKAYGQLRQIKTKISSVLKDGEDETATALRLDELVHAKGTNAVKALLLNGNSYYSIGQIKNVKTTRKSGSDMLLMEYQTEDPAITQATLSLLIDVFRERYANFKSSEANSVVNYYTSKTQNSQTTLQKSEAKLKSFGVTNKIIDYGQQTTTAATSKAALTNDYNQEMMQFQAAKAAVSTLAKRIADRSAITANNDALSTKREEIVKVQAQLANARIYGQPKNVIADLEAKLNRLTGEMKSAALQHYELGNTAESVAQRTLVEEWLRKVLTYEESAARLTVYKQQIDELDKATSELTPLGSTLKQLNREVDVAEKEYIENLSELNKARIRQKNAEMEGPLSVLDEPDFPMEPLASKRWMLVGAGLATGLFLALLLTLIRYLLDNRINTPQQAETLTGMPMAAIFPMVRGRSAKARRTVQAMLEQVRSGIAIERQGKPQSTPYMLISLVSNRPKQGKTWVGLQLAEQYARAGHRVAYCCPQRPGTSPEAIPEVTLINYPVGADFIDTPGIDALMSAHSARPAMAYDVIILELPSLFTHAIPAYLVAQTTVSILILSARSTWTREDVTLSTLFKRAASRSILAVLNQADLSVAGVLPPAAERVRLPASESGQAPAIPLPEGVKTA